MNNVSYSFLYHATVTTKQPEVVVVVNIPVKERKKFFLAGLSLFRHSMLSVMGLAEISTAFFSLEQNCSTSETRSETLFTLWPPLVQLTVPAVAPIKLEPVTGSWQCTRPTRH